MALREMEGVERIAVKMTCAADLLQKISTQLTKDLEVSERKVTCYICQAKLLLSWKQGNAAVRVVGTTVKTVGMLAVIASTLNPKFRMAVSVGDKMWKLGTGLKILSYVANILKDMWQKGCRQSLLDFMHHTSLLVRNVGLLDELVNDLRERVRNLSDSHQMDTTEQIWNVVSGFLPNPEGVYIRHIICLIVCNENYSPLFDFAALITDPSNDSNVLQLMREIESIQFLEFVQENDSKTLVAIGSFLHVTRELVDFLDSLTKLRDSDCVFLKQCLTRFAQESKKIKSLVSFLKDLKTIKTELQNVNLRTRDESLKPNFAIEQSIISDSERSENPLPSSSKILIPHFDENKEENSALTTGSKTCKPAVTVHTVQGSIPKEQEITTACLSDS